MVNIVLEYKYFPSGKYTIGNDTYLWKQKSLFIVFRGNFT
jgi:hypothetical protein